jgi:hypothetical protein
MLSHRRLIAADSDWEPVEITVTVLLKASQPPQTQIQHRLEGVLRFSM